MALELVRTRVARFIEDYALYRKLALQRIFQDAGNIGPAHALAPEFPRVLPAAVHLDCPTCGRTQPFRDAPGPRRAPDVGGGSNPGIPATPDPGSSFSPAAVVADDAPRELIRTSGVYEVRKRCTFCETFEYRFWIEVNADEGWIRKVGQVPRIGGVVSPELKAALGDGVELYRRAQACVDESFGVGACSYLRRLLEDQVDPLLRLLLEVRRDETAPQEELDEIEEALTRTAFKEKATVLYRKMPQSMKLEGDNPIKALHEGLSEGMHGLDEQQCTTLAAEGMGIFEYIVRQLSREHARMRDKKDANEEARKFRALSSLLKSERTDEATR